MMESTTPKDGSDDVDSATHDASDRFGIPINAKPVPERHPLRWVGAFIVLGLLAWVARTFAVSSIEWHTIPAYFVSDSMRTGLVGTVKLTLAVMTLAILLGTLLAVAQQSGNPVLRILATASVWVFRGVPALVQLLLWFNLAIVIPNVDLGPLYSGKTNELMTPFMAALLGLGLAEAAYMAEIVRSGILSVPSGQVEAAKSMGMPSSMAMRRVILPQAVRVVIPPTGNQFIGMLKYTSLAFAVAYSDLLSEASKIYNANFKVIEVLLSATIWYLILCTVSSLIQGYIERRLASDLSPAARARLRLESEALG